MIPYSESIWLGPVGDGDCNARKWGNLVNILQEISCKTKQKNPKKTQLFCSPMNSFLLQIKI